MTKFYRRLPEIVEAEPIEPESDSQEVTAWQVTSPSFLWVSAEEFKARYEPVPERAPLAFFFGCVGTAGHYVHDRHLRHVPYETTPWGTSLDGGACKSTTCECKSLKLEWGKRGHKKNILPDGEEKEGHALLHHMEGFTAVCFWDRSVDTRGKSCAAFIAEGTLGFRQVLEVARETFPSILARFKFDIVEVAE